MQFLSVVGTMSTRKYSMSAKTEGKHIHITDVWLIPTADEHVGVQVKLRNPLRTRDIPERFCGGDSLRISLLPLCALCYVLWLPSLAPRKCESVNCHSSRIKNALSSSGDADYYWNRPNKRLMVSAFSCVNAFYALVTTTIRIDESVRLGL